MANWRLVRATGAVLALLAACDGPISYRVGTLNSSSFSEGVLALGTDQLSAGGQTSVTVDIIDHSGRRLHGVNATVVFTSGCVASGQSRIEPASVNTTRGIATATYFATGCSGQDVVRANVVVAGSTGPLAAQATLTVAATDLGSLSYVSATSTMIGMKGALGPQESTIKFKLLSSDGEPVGSRSVSFSLTSRVGGLDLSPMQGTTDSNGFVQTTVLTGTLQTAVKVTASVQTDSGQMLSTQSENLIISTGLPNANGLSLTSTKLSLDGSCDGETALLSFRAADRFNNPAANGTAASFSSEGGGTGSSCVLTDASGAGDEVGVCRQRFMVQNPKPDNGRITVLATVVGEETFADANGNGQYDNGEPFSDQPESFLDADESGTRGSDESFRDFNGDGQYDGPNGSFDGYVCATPGSSANNYTPENCSTKILSIGTSTVLVFSNNTPQVTNLADNAETYRASSPGAVTLTVSDTNGNSLPTGTTFTLILSNGTVDDPAGLGPFNEIGPRTLHFSFKAGATATMAQGREIAKLLVQLPDTACGAGQSLTLLLFTYKVV